MAVCGNHFSWMESSLRGAMSRLTASSSTTFSQATAPTSAPSACCQNSPVPVGKQPHLVTPSVFFDHLDSTLPALKLRGVQLTQMQHPALQHPLATYPQTLMYESHKDMKITGGEWDAFMDDFQQTLDKFGVPAQEKADIIWD